MSANQRVITALTEKMVALGAEDHLLSRAESGSRAKFDAALA